MFNLKSLSKFNLIFSKIFYYLWDRAELKWYMSQGHLNERERLVSG